MSRRKVYYAHSVEGLAPEEGWQRLDEHLQVVASEARELTAKVGLKTFGEIIGLLHDFGKYSEDFQQYICQNSEKSESLNKREISLKDMKGKIDHSSAGSQYIWEALQTGDASQKQLVGQIMALCIASHHSGLIDCLKPDGTDSFTARIEKSKEATHLEEATSNADGPVLNRIVEALSSSTIQDEFDVFMKKMTAKQSPEITVFGLGLLTRFVLSALLDADRLNTSGRTRCNGFYSDWTGLIAKFEKHIALFSKRNHVDEIRTNISARCLEFSQRERGIYQLTVPTGGGKTLSSLRFALHHAEKNKMDRIIYVIPYTSIIDQNARTVRAILENGPDSHQIVLEHHSNLTPENETQQSKILAENWDAPIVFTTAVQFMETLFGAGTRGARRMHQLANSVIIFDEIQTIPVKVVHLFNNAVNFLTCQCNSTVVLCTATQPLLHEVDVAKGAVQLSSEPEIMPAVNDLFRDLRRVEVMDRSKPAGWTEEEVADLAVQEITDSGSVLIIVNTKSAAQEVHKQCRRRTDAKVLHLSTNMCAEHRSDVLAQVRECLNPASPEPVICVSTQLIEAGVDVDFGTVIRYMAGLDSIAQAAGRCNRNGLRKSGKVYVVNPSHENLDRLADMRIAKDKAERVFGEYLDNPDKFDRDLIGLRAMERYYRYYFFDRAGEMTYPVNRAQIGRDDDLLTLLSTNNLSVEAYKRANRKAPPFFLRQSFKTAAETFKAIDAPTEGVIVPYGDGKQIISDLCAAYDVGKGYDLLKRAQRYAVNMFPNVMARLVEQHCIHEVQEGSGILYLEDQYYSREYGVSTKTLQAMPFLNL